MDDIVVYELFNYSANFSIALFSTKDLAEIELKRYKDHGINHCIIQERTVRGK